MADEVNQFSLCSWQDLLKGFKHERIDEQMIHRGEVRPERHIIEIGVRFQ